VPEVITTNGWDQMRWERVEHIAPHWHVTILETTNKSRDEVAAESLAWCRRALAGEVEVIRVSDAVR